ncbi:hypothetical protein FFJ24_007825 [Pedobacter sp. KBS0701]|uniref:hypothetical protein n=1 Tax=Pedobacter sp. KBS0701 TaxID=2578106 RepID=UPI00110ED1C2|nr:hypothetical protein [Pedobacter sp. KBS0701]QDW24726.1 hypothetical protein FFJ24_007825 [Pedobacter sp. KBS0701]
MIKNLLFTLLTISITSTIFISCTKSVDEKLEDLKKEKLAFEKKVAAIKNDSLRKQAKEFGGMLFWFQEIDLENERPPKDTVYDENPFLILKDYGSTGDMASNYLDGILVEKDESRGDKIELKLHYPFALPFAQKTSWKSVKFNDNSSTDIIEDENNSLISRQVVRTNWNNEEGFDILYPDEKSYSADPVSLNGSVEAQIPKAILKFTFAGNERGDTKEQHGIKVKLASVKGHAVSIEVENPNKTDPAVDTEKMDLVTILATDKTKKFLHQSGSSSGSGEMFDFYKKLLNEVVDNPEKVGTLQKDLDEEQRKYDEKHKNRSYYSAYFKGTVEDVVIYVMDYSKATIRKKNFSLPVYSFKAAERGYNSTAPYQEVFDIPTYATAYDPAVDKLLSTKPELYAGEIGNKIKIDQSSMTYTTPSGDQEKWRVSFEYPELMSSFFINNISRYEDAKEVAFFEEQDGKQISIPKDSIDYGNGEFNGTVPVVEFNRSSLNFVPKGILAKAKYVKGVMQLNLAEISKASYRIDQLPPGITVSGNKVMVDEAIIKDKILIYPKNTSGRYLKKITSASFSRGDNFGPHIKADYYYGKPFLLECYLLKGNHLVDYHFNVKLTYDEQKKEEKTKSK